MAAKVHPALLSRIERGLAEPTLDERERILKALGDRAASALPLATQLINLLQASRQETDSNH